jgi:hypothetical protein
VKKLDEAVLSDGPDVVGRRRILLKRLKENGLEPCDWTWKGCMPESVCGRGVRCCSVLFLRVEDEEGMWSIKPCMDPRRGAVEAVADEKDERRRRVFWRVNWPVIAPNARERELE